MNRVNDVRNVDPAAKRSHASRHSPTTHSARSRRARPRITPHTSVSAAPRSQSQTQSHPRARAHASAPVLSISILRFPAAHSATTPAQSSLLSPRWPAPHTACTHGLHPRHGHLHRQHVRPTMPRPTHHPNTHAPSLLVVPALTQRPSSLAPWGLLCGAALAAKCEQSPRPLPT